MNKFLKKIMMWMNLASVLLIIIVVLGLEFAPLDQLNLDFLFKCFIFITVTLFINFMRCFSIDYREEWVRISRDEHARAEDARYRMEEERVKLQKIYRKLLGSIN
jgi:hypothetical protein